MNPGKSNLIGVEQFETNNVFCFSMGSTLGFACREESGGGPPHSKTLRARRDVVEVIQAAVADHGPQTLRIRVNPTESKHGQGRRQNEE
ncbi:MAG TPA: hypothetical protein VG347_07250 [Verrucomicrobiae bacterium]|nr:hypothetical protein [Verrucomicrobiae bacterium]